MTLIEQFPDVSMMIRKKRKADLKHNAPFIFKGISFTPFVLDQRFYDNEFKQWHYKLSAGISILLTGIFLLILHGHSLWKYLIS
jgi:hypothetical protein